MTNCQPDEPSTLDGYRYRRSGPVELYLGDARDVLHAMPDASVDCLVTSPPFWSLLH
jgi:predicted methyltransferase